MLARAVQLFRPFDVSTAVGRGHERYRRIALATVASLAQRLVGVGATLVAVRITLGYLGAERYGLYVTIGAIIALLGFADLGISNGLINAIAEAHGRDDERLARIYVSSALAILTPFAVLLGTLFALAYRWIPWADIFNVSSPNAVAEAGPAAAVLVGCFLAGLPLGVVQRVQLGYQEAFTNSLWLAVGNLLSLAGIVVAVALKAGLPWLVLATAGAPVLALVFNSAVLFGIRRPAIRPHVDFVDIAAARRILGLGSYFFIIQVAMVLGFESDSIVIAQVLGPDKVPEYSIPFSMFMFFPVLLSFVLIPLWPAYGDAVERRDRRWVQRTFRRSIALGLGLNIPAAVALIAFGDVLVRLWVGNRIEPSTGLLIGLGLWMVLTGLGGPVSALLNGAGALRFQAICAALMVVTNLPLSIVLAHVIGVSGVVYATVISLLVWVYAPTAVFIPLWFRRFESPSE